MKRLHARTWMRASVALVAAGATAVMAGCAPTPKSPAPGKPGSQPDFSSYASLKIGL